MKIADKEVNGVLVVSVEGRLTAATEGLFKSETGGLLTKSDKTVFDCSNLEYIGSTGLGVIVRFYKELKTRGGRLALAALQPKPRLVFEITRANKIFDIFDSLDAAIKFLKSDADSTAETEY